MQVMNERIQLNITKHVIFGDKSFQASDCTKNDNKLTKNKKYKNKNK